MRKALYILSKLSDHDLQWLMRAGRPTAVPAAAVLIRQGQPIDSLYVVLDGELTVSTEAGGDTPLAWLRSGEIVGELSFLDARPPAATVRAARDSLVLVVPRAVLAAKIAEDLAFAARFYEALGTFLAARLRTTVARLGYGPAGGSADDDGLDDALLENLDLAAAKFDWMLKRLRAG